MQRQNAELEKTQLQISTGLRILKPSDDPTGSVKVLNLNANIGVIDQYSRNSAVAQASLSQQESVLGSINDTLQRVRELTVQGMSPANHDSARLDIALEIEERFKEILSLANTRDANGEYLFSGSLSDRMPFINQGGTVAYQGDQVARELQVAIAKPEIADSLRKQGVDPEFLPGSEYAARANADFRRWGEVIRERGIKME
jgi:flagellar hook-associated protein 3 FlgL